MRNITLIANITLSIKGTIRGGSFLSCIEIRDINLINLINSSYISN